MAWLSTASMTCLVAPGSRPPETVSYARSIYPGFADSSLVSTLPIQSTRLASAKCQPTILFRFTSISIVARNLSVHSLEQHFSWSESFAANRSRNTGTEPRSETTSRLRKRALAFSRWGFAAQLQRKRPMPAFTPTAAFLLSAAALTFAVLCLLPLREVFPRTAASTVLLWLVTPSAHGWQTPEQFHPFRSASRRSAAARPFPCRVNPSACRVRPGRVRRGVR